MRNHMPLFALMAQIPALSFAMNDMLNPARFIKSHAKRVSYHAIEVCLNPNILEPVTNGTVCYNYLDLATQCQAGITLQDSFDIIEYPELPERPVTEQKDCMCNTKEIWSGWNDCFDCLRINGGEEGEEWFGPDYLRSMSAAYCEATGAPETWSDFVDDWIEEYVATASATTSGWSVKTAEPYNDGKTPIPTEAPDESDDGDNDDEKVNDNAAGHSALGSQAWTGVAAAGIAAAAIFL